MLSAFGMRQTLIVGMAGEEEGAKWAEVGGKQQEEDTRNLQRLQLAEQTKEKGNVAFKGGDLEAAAANYHKVAHPHTPHTRKHLVMPSADTAIQLCVQKYRRARAHTHTHTHTHTHARSNHTHAQKLKTWMVGMVAACSVDA